MFVRFIKTLLSFLGIGQPDHLGPEEGISDELRKVLRSYPDAEESDIESIEHVSVYVDDAIVPFHEWPKHGVTLKMVRKVFKTWNTIQVVNPRFENQVIEVRLLVEHLEQVPFFRAFPLAAYEDLNLVDLVEVTADGEPLKVIDWPKHLVTLRDIKEVVRSGKPKEYHDKEWIYIGLRKVP